MTKPQDFDMNALLKSDRLMNVSARVHRLSLRVDRTPGADRWVVRRDGADIFDGTREQVAIFLLGVSHGAHPLQDDVGELRRDVERAFEEFAARIAPLDRELEVL